MFNERDFHGATYAITGAVSGMGAACSRLLIEVGATVIGIDRNAVAGEAMRQELGERFDFRALDITDEDAVTAMAGQLAVDYDAVDGLVNCAGVFTHNQRAENLPVADFRRAFEVNTIGTFLVCRAFFSLLQKAKSGAGVVNIASQAALVSLPEQGAYTASKGALTALTRSMAIDWARDNVRVNAVCPGFTVTEMSERDLNDELRDAVRRRVPLGRLFRAEEMARVIVFLASPLASAMTGAVVPVDGGWTAGEAVLPTWGRVEQIGQL